jgi:hypothetical protein
MSVTATCLHALVYLLDGLLQILCKRLQHKQQVVDCSYCIVLIAVYLHAMLMLTVYNCCYLYYYYRSAAHTVVLHYVLFRRINSSTNRHV